MRPDPRQAPLRELVDLTTRQLDAARRMDAAAMQSLNDARSDALFALQVAGGDAPSPSPEQAAELVDLVRELGRLELRLRSVVGTVLTALGNAPETTYRPTGQLVG